MRTQSVRCSGCTRGHSVTDVHICGWSHDRSRRRHGRKAWCPVDAAWKTAWVCRGLLSSIRMYACERHIVDLPQGCGESPAMSSRLPRATRCDCVALERRDWRNIATSIRVLVSIPATPACGQGLACLVQALAAGIE